ncbi:ATPase [Thermaerobacter sp. FW80]|uniref:SRPBCC domain-containing protein n=1 Tax=Thermaerobacter sp. FW80 TaxID=2546351 RepID=UPI001074A2FC|nr:SRPBCC domain-containing protein [Thermaerobacter sp. FW80]QBS36569.1 ATPase [Thermaerobacter sp. FW80]
MIRRTVVVRRPVEDVFDRFTAGMGHWWPLEQFSYGGDRAGDLILEGHAGGRFYERFRDGEEHEIGRVLVYDPPHRVVFTWNQANWAGSTEVEVRFHPEGTGTRIELEHRGWEQLGEAGTGTQQAFDGGWGVILDRFASWASP